MTDPLRYLISEGFIALFYYPNLDQFGKFSGRLRTTENVRNSVSILTLNGKKCMRVGLMVYPIDADFWLEYGVRCTDADDALAKSEAWAKETNELYEIFSKQQETAS
jgi:hypothetical protein